MMDGMEKVMEKGTCLTLSTDNLSHLWPITGGRAFLNVERLTDQEASTCIRLLHQIGHCVSHYCPNRHKTVDLLFLSSCQESAIDTQLDNRHIMLRGDTVRMKNICGCFKC